MSALTLYPAIDLLEGRVVRLHKGERASATVYANEAAATARVFAADGAQWIHVVDLQAAFDGPEARQTKVIRDIVEAVGDVPVQLGGGLRDLDVLASAFDDGISRAMLGTVAVERPELVSAAIARFGADRICVAIDEKDGVVKVRGWTSGSGPEATTLARDFAAAGVRWFLHSAISRDGTLSGPDLGALRRVCAAVAPLGGRVVCAGGVGSVLHLQELYVENIMGLDGAVAGRALYEGALTVPAALAALRGGAA
jgi:phosphoribosylformimino-5-aminoimidazole carboxamide ribotide isomerase